MVKYKCAHCEFRDENKEVVQNHIFDEHFYVELKGDVLVITFRPDGQEHGQK